MDTQQQTSPWKTAEEAAQRARVGKKLIYRAARTGKLRSARIDGRRNLRFLECWVDSWLQSSSTPIEAQR